MFLGRWRRFLERLAGNSDRELEKEIRAHLELEEEEQQGAGLSTVEARYAARRAFGNTTLIKEDTRAMWGWTKLEQLMQDLPYAVRTLSHSRGFTLGALTVLALGIGANTAMFSVVNSVLLRPLAYPDADRIVAVETFRKNTGLSGRNVSAPDFHDWKEQNTVFAAMAYYNGGRTGIVVDGAGEYANVQNVTPEFFEVFGQSPLAGRLLSEAENRSPVAVVSAAWAESHFGSVSAALGKSLTTSGQSREIVGVSPRGFRFSDAVVAKGGEDTDIWVPAGLVPETTSRTSHNYRAVGRLKPEVSLEEAREQMRMIGDRIEREYPENRFKTVALEPLQQRLTQNVNTTLWALLGAVVLVLLIACANVANLMLARATARTREIALRAALGASRTRLVRQLLTESLLLAGLACGLGVLLANALLKAVLVLAPGDLPRLDEIRVDTPVLLFTTAISAFASLLFGLLPAVQATRIMPGDALKRSGSRGSVGTARSWLRPVIVAGEVALSVMLLTGAGLLLRSFQHLQHVDLGFTTERVLAAHASYTVSPDSWQKEAADDSLRALDYHRELIQRIRTMPGVIQAAAAFTLPLGSAAADAAYWIQGRESGRPGEYPTAEIQAVTPGYFSTLGIPVRTGRDFSESDTLERPPVAIISEGLAQAAFPGQNPLGQRIKTGFRQTTNEWMEIVGVAADVRRDPARAVHPELFVSTLQHPGAASPATFLIRARREPESLAAAIREASRRLSPDTPLRFETMAESFSRSLAYPRFRTLLVGGFAVLAAFLAIAGIYSVLTYLAGQRTAEFGVRFALGARGGQVARLVMGEGLRLACSGLLLGLAGAFALSRTIRTFLYGVTESDPLTYAAVAGLVIAVTLVAIAHPAWRASKVDPMTALRQE